MNRKVHHEKIEISTFTNLISDSNDQLELMCPKNIIRFFPETTI